MVIINRFRSFLFPNTPRTPRQLAGAIAIVGTFLLVCALVAKPVYSKFKDWRASQLVAKADAALEDGQTTWAKAAARAALNLKPNSIDALRLNARATPSEDQIETLVLNEQLLQRQRDNPRPADLRHYVETCITAGFLGSSELAMELLLEQQPNKSINWLLMADYLLARGQPKEAIHAVANALAISPQDSQATLLASRIAVESGNEPVRHAAAKKLLELGDNANRIGLSALTVLATCRAPLPKEVLATAALKLRNHGLSSGDAALLASRLELVGAPAQRERVLRETIERHRTNQFDQLLGWLFFVGAPDQVVALLPVDRALQNRIHFEALAIALRDLGKHDELLAIIKRHGDRIPLDKLGLDLIRMDCHTQLGDKATADAHWNRILWEAKLQNPEISLVVMAQWLERNAHPRRAMTTYELLLTMHREFIPQWYDAIVRLSRRNKDAAALSRVSRELRDQFPENPVYQHNEAYAGMLLGQPLPEVIKTLEAIVAEHPRIIASQCALSLAEALSGNRTRARVTADRARATGVVLSDLDELILATTQTRIDGTSKGNGHPIPTDLFPEEVALFGVKLPTSDDGAADRRDPSPVEGAP